MPNSYWEALLDWRDEQWELHGSQEYDAWLDSQEQSYPLPEDCDPNYENDFDGDPVLLAIATFDLPIAC